MGATGSISKSFPSRETVSFRLNDLKIHLLTSGDLHSEENITELLLEIPLGQNFSRVDGKVVLIDPIYSSESIASLLQTEGLIYLSKLYFTPIQYKRHSDIIQYITTTNEVIILNH